MIEYTAAAEGWWIQLKESGDSGSQLKFEALWKLSNIWGWLDNRTSLKTYVEQKIF
jgi:hypothetical protein